jgi:hypothetical protein
MPGTVEIYGLDTGLTLTAKLFPYGSDTQAGSDVTLTEKTNCKFDYTFSTELTGLHRIIVYEGSDPYGACWGTLAASGTIGTCDSLFEALYLDAAITSRRLPPAARST